MHCYSSLVLSISIMLSFGSYFTEVQSKDSSNPEDATTTTVRGVYMIEMEKQERKKSLINIEQLFVLW